MKFFTLLLILIIFVVQSYAQDIVKYAQKFSNKTDSIKQISLKPHLYADTIWVIDSILSFKIDDETNNLIHERTYEILSRNEKGNKLVSLDRVAKGYLGITGNIIFDSIVYFNGEQIKKRFAKEWNNVQEQWVETDYIEYNTPELLNEYRVMRFSNSTQQYQYGFWDSYKNTNNRVDTLYSYDIIKETNLWKPVSKIIYYYDENGNDTLQMIYNWEYNDWKKRKKRLLFFEAGYLNTRITYNRDTINNVWDIQQKDLFHYTNAGELDTLLGKLWDNQLNNWYDYSKSIIEYDYLNRYTNRLFLLYEPGTQQLENYWNAHFTYGDNHRVDTHQSWDLSLNMWINNQQYIYSYIQEGVVDTAQGNHWNVETQQWQGYYRDVYRFDANINVIDRIRYNFNENDWEIINKDDYYWSPFILNSILSISEGVLVAIPNPACNKIVFCLPDNLKQFKGVSIQIFNLSGQKVAEITKMNDRLFWDCSTENPGLYIYSTMIDGISYSGKIVVN